LILITWCLLAAWPACGDTDWDVVVDTDVAADDARALALLFTVPSIRVIAVVTSDGVSPPDVGATNVCRILRFLKADGVAVGMGRALDKPPPPVWTGPNSANRRSRLPAWNGPRTSFGGRCGMPPAA
jgi:inosine-uridine nucleoside N-ribohydrolase